MKNTSWNLKAIAFALGVVNVLVLLPGCMGIDTTNEHLGSMDETSKQLSQNMELMQKHMTLMETELAVDREYLKTVSTCIKVMSESLSSIQVMGEQAFQAVINNLLKPTPDAKTPDAEDLLPPVQKPATNG